jgi:hypothetical protein
VSLCGKKILTTKEKLRISPRNTKSIKIIVKKIKKDKSEIKE